MVRYIFVQSELLADVVALEVTAATTLAEFRQQLLGVLPKDDREGVFIFLEDDDDENAIDRIVDVPDGLRIHLHRLKSIDVHVHYAGRQVHRTFRPGVTVARVKKWSAHELGIGASDAADMTLQVSGTENRPDSDVHIGALVVAPAKKLSFNLVPSPRVNG